MVIIGGRSGSGKSTILELCAGLKKPLRGRVFLDGKDIAALTRKELLMVRQRIGYMFQQHALIANYSLFDNIALPLRITGKYTEREISVQVRAMLEEVALFGVDTSFPESLSIGQLKSASLARALITNPDILFLDEPVSGTDERTAQGIFSVLNAFLQTKKRTVIMISHEASAWSVEHADYYVLDGGRLQPVSSAEFSRKNCADI
jgi:ABC-type lipoprotein export system ATPase subunit